MATEQQLAQALNPYEPNLLQNLAKGQSQPSLLGNTPKLTSYGLPETPEGGGGYADPNPSWSALSNAEKAGYYAANPIMAGLTQLGQQAFGLTSLGQIQNLAVPNFVSEQSLVSRGVDPAAYQGAKEGFRASEMGMQNNVNAAFEAQQAAQQQAAQQQANNAQSMQSMQDAQAADTSAAQSISDQSSAGSEAGGYGTGDTSGGFGEGQYAKGGKVNKGHLTGPDPKGPDDGYGALQGGEFVVKKAAVRKYGEGMLGKINAGKYTPRS
jgi:hypothetical protein